MGLVQRPLEDLFLHGGLALLPGLFPEEGVLAHLVEILAQGALALEFAADVGEGDDGGRVGQGDGPLADAFVVHGKPPHMMDFP